MKRIELYQTEELELAKRQRTRAAILMITIGAIGLAVCIVLCTFVTRRNQNTMLPFVIGASIVAGWIVIFLSHAKFGTAHAAVRHDDLMLTGERETFVGRFTKTDEVKRVRHGVPVRKILAEIDGRERVLSVSEARSAQMPDAFSGTVEAVYDFIAAYEVNDDQTNPT